MVLPNLFIPGAAKSGTSALHEYLGQHPQIFMSQSKEPHFFSHPDRFQTRLHEYLDLFAGAESYPVRGESSTGYMIFPHVIDRINSMIPQAKFIFIFRNPIDRAYSHYWWLRGLGFEKQQFRTAILGELDARPDPRADIGGNGLYRYYYVNGCYASWLVPFIEAFGRSSVHVVISEQLAQDPTAVLDECFQFLGVHPYPPIAKLTSNETQLLSNPDVYQFILEVGRGSKLANFLKRILPTDGIRAILDTRKRLLGMVRRALKQSNTYPPMDELDRNWLASLYKDQVNQLRELTGKSFTDWNLDFPLEADVVNVA